LAELGKRHQLAAFCLFEMGDEVFLYFPRMWNSGEAVRAAIFFRCDRQILAMTHRKGFQPDQGPVEYRNVKQKVHEYPSSILALAPCGERRLPDRHWARSLRSSG